MDTDTVEVCSLIESSSEICKKRWELLSEEARSVIESLLHPDPTKRISIDDAMSTPWLSCPFNSAIPSIIVEEMTARKQYFNTLSF